MRKAKLTVIGKNHEDIRKQLSGVLKQLGMKNLKVGNVTDFVYPDNEFEYQIPKLIEKGILKED